MTFVSLPFWCAAPVHCAPSSSVFSPAAILPFSLPQVTPFKREDQLWGFTVSFLKDGESAADVRVAFDEEITLKHDWVGRGAGLLPRENSAQPQAGKHAALWLLERQATDLCWLLHSLLASGGLCVHPACVLCCHTSNIYSCADAWCPCQMGPGRQAAKPGSRPAKGHLPPALDAAMRACLTVLPTLLFTPGPVGLQTAFPCWRAMRRRLWARTSRSARCDSSLSDKPCYPAAAEVLGNRLPISLGQPCDTPCRRPQPDRPAAAAGC